MRFYCNGKKGVCTKSACDGCEDYHGTGGKWVATRADLIRAMGDEELAQLLYNLDFAGYCSNMPECGQLLDTEEGIPEEKCIGCLISWLRQPAEEVGL